MQTYEVSYTVGERIASVLIEAPSPSEATRRFYEAPPEEDAIVLCVVRQ